MVNNLYLSKTISHFQEGKPTPNLTVGMYTCHRWYKDEYKWKQACSVSNFKNPNKML